MHDWFLNKLDYNYNKYQPNITVKGDVYKVKLLFPLKNFVSFGTDHHSIFLMSNIFLSEKVDGILVPQLQIAYICDTTIYSHKHLNTLCH